ncbi:MAG TPA: hypothetical protein VHE11_08965 [Steroidobacteraceae bacterium]|nr:hypothetical protein [Steroidobacteraceae bacterium]
MRQQHYRRMALASGLAVLAAAAAARSAPAQAPKSSLPGSGLPAVSLSGACLKSGKAYLRARIRGTVRLDVDLHGAGLTCEGGPRVSGGGIRMGFEGRVRPGGRRLRMVFGIAGAREGRPGRELPTNLTVIFEGESLFFSTQGQDNCTVDRLTQEPIGAGRAPTPAQGAARKAGAASATPKIRSYVVTAHGFCVAPANDIGGHRRILVSTFDFAGRADFNTP